MFVLVTLYLKNLQFRIVNSFKLEYLFFTVRYKSETKWGIIDFLDDFLFGVDFQRRILLNIKSESINSRRSLIGGIPHIGSRSQRFFYIEICF